jgi:hypothetical protein
LFVVDRERIFLSFAENTKRQTSNPKTKKGPPPGGAPVGRGAPKKNDAHKGPCLCRHRFHKWTNGNAIVLAVPKKNKKKGQGHPLLARKPMQKKKERRPKDNRTNKKRAQDKRRERIAVFFGSASGEKRRTKELAP